MDLGEGATTSLFRLERLDRAPANLVLALPSFDSNRFGTLLDTFGIVLGQQYNRPIGLTFFTAESVAFLHWNFISIVLEILQVVMSSFSFFFASALRFSIRAFFFRFITAGLFLAMTSAIKILFRGLLRSKETAAVNTAKQAIANL